LNLVKSGMIDINHPDAIHASKIIGFEKALAIITSPHEDCMIRRIQGSYGNGKSK